jgi:hypothetical protein
MSDEPEMSRATAMRMSPYAVALHELFVAHPYINQGLMAQEVRKGSKNNNWVNPYGGYSPLKVEEAHAVLANVKSVQKMLNYCFNDEAMRTENSVIRRFKSLYRYLTDPRVSNLYLFRESIGFDDTERNAMNARLTYVADMDANHSLTDSELAAMEVKGRELAIRLKQDIARVEVLIPRKAKRVRENLISRLAKIKKDFTFCTICGRKPNAQGIWPYKAMYAIWSGARPVPHICEDCAFELQALLPAKPVKPTE